ncbi:isoleucine--tRNA ligase [Candidatus Micrarchaeota archaeon]|nr:isoleucine--tRNA ligase [Candidatus Micrarchaeota archaeon]
MFSSARAYIRDAPKPAKNMLTYNQIEIEKQILEFWEKNKIPQKLSSRRPNAKRFFLLDGPPYANAQPHVGHVKTTVCKDIWSRYKQMQGFSSYFQAGFDCHGLPTEVMVEKELGIQSKGDIEKIGIDKFDALCLEKVINTEKGWMEYYRRLGAWRAYAEPYFTYKDYYIESGWWTLKQLHEKGLLIEGEKPVYWCPHCETTLSGYEVSDSYKDMADPSIFVKFKLLGTQNEYLLVWTTTPWTLAANMAVIVHPLEIYVKAKIGNEIFILAEKRVEAILKEKLKANFEIVGKIKGAELEGLQYLPLLDVPQQKELDDKARKVRLSIPIMTTKKYKKHKLSHKKENANAGNMADGKIGDNSKPVLVPESKNPIAATETKSNFADKITGTEEKEEYEEFVSMKEGTGLVHCAPGHGQTDHYLGKYYGLQAVSPVDEHGKFTEKAGSILQGIFVKTADKKIIDMLQAENKLLISEQITHRAALCWRCKFPLIFRLSKQWYLKVSTIKDKMISENEKHVKWMPEYGKVKFHNWLVDREDWAISQQRYWGIPLPIWRCKNCQKFDVIGSKEELKQRSARKLNDSELTDLHRHVVDKIELNCLNCASIMVRERDILNVWFDSGIAPWASLGYPFKNKELFESMFPVDLINESQDQIRGWFDSLMFTSVGLFGNAPYKSVAMMGWVLDEKGEKMSKSLGNVVPAIEGIEKLSADAIRMYYCYEIAPWEVQKFSFKTAEEVKRAFAILFNIFAFYKTYSENAKIPELNIANLKLEDKWVLAKLNVLKQQSAESIEKFEMNLVGREMIRFLVDDFSRTYIKLIRDRVSDEGSTPDKLTCLSLIRKVLIEYSMLIAPISPYISEYLYQQLKVNGKESVHFEDYPKMDEKLVDVGLIESFQVVSKVSEAVNSLRQELKLKLRWPVEEILISGDEKTQNAVALLSDVLKNHCNAQNVSVGENSEFGKKEFEGGSVFIPKTLSEKMIISAILREASRAVQAERKKAGFVVNEKISLTINFNDAKVREAFSGMKSALALEVGASKVDLKMLDSELLGNHSIELDLNELKIGLKVRAKFSKV